MAPRGKCAWSIYVLLRAGADLWMGPIRAEQSPVESEYVSPSPPRQERSRRTLARVVDAATELFGERGEVGFTLPEVATRAQVSVGTLYRRFATKEDLLVAVFDRLREEERGVRAAEWSTIDWASMPIRDMTDRLVADLSRIWREQESFMRAVLLRHLTHDEGDHAFSHGIETMHASMGRFTAVIRECGRPVCHPDPEPACHFAYRMIIGMSARRTALAIETQTPRPVGWDELIDQISDAVARYLFGPGYEVL